MAAISNQAPTFSTAAKAAGVPLQIKTEDIAELGAVTFIEAEPATSTLPDGRESEGMFVTIADIDGSKYTAFIGGVALLRVLREVPLPFRAQIVKVGRTWTFADPD